MLLGPMRMDQANLMKALRWVVDVDPGEISWSVHSLRTRMPEASAEQLAQRVFNKARWQAAAAGLATGIPANPWVVVPAAALDMTTVLRIEVKAAAKTALLFDPSFFDDEDAGWELLVPIFGAHTASQFLREAGILGGMGVTRELIKKSLASGGMQAVQQIAAKYFGVALTQRALSTKLLPVVGGAIGGAWNYAEVRLLGDRCIKYFRGEVLPAAKPARRLSHRASSSDSSPDTNA